MRDPNRSESCFQGRERPREGEEDALSEKEARLGDLCMAVGSINDALAYYKRALSQTGEDDAEARLEVILKVSACLRRQGKSHEALSFVESVGGSFSGRRRRDMLAEKATLLCLLGRYGEAARVCEEAQQQECGSHREKDAGIYLVLGHVLARLCKWQQAITCLEQAATFSRMCGDVKTLGNALNNLGIVYKNLCRFRDSARFLKKAVGVARQLQDDASLSIRLLNLANTLLKQGEVEEAGRAVTECARIASTLNIDRTRTLAAICRARVERAGGDIPAAMAHIEAALAEAEAGDDPRIWLVGCETLGELLLERGEPAKSREVLADCLEKISPHTKDVEAEIKSRLAEACLALGRKEEARHLAVDAARIAEDIGDLYEAGRALRCLALASSQSTAWDELLRRAERIFRKVGARLELGITLRARAFLSRAGSRPQGHEGRTEPRSGRAPERYLRRALAIFETCSAKRHRVFTLCDLAAVYDDLAEHEKGLACLEDARAASGEDPCCRKAISDVRVRMDSRFANKLPPLGSDRPTGVEAALAFLRSGLGASGFILASLDSAGAPGLIRVSGMPHDTAGLLAVAVSGQSQNPFISTDVNNIKGVEGDCDRFRSLLGIRFGEQGRRYLLITCWCAGKRPGRESYPEASLMVKAYYEIRDLLPGIELGLRPCRENPQPVCIGGMVTGDGSLKQVLLSLSRIAASPASVLITGETGTGKELVARALHALSPRSACQLVVQNCAALPEQLLESELFGHKAGAFTGARTDKRGLLEIANGGTFFLDEVGEVSPAIQAKMLRSIETGEIRRLGDTVTRPIDARILSATNKNLEDEVERGTFRRDLYYRLNVVSVTLPPLRERVGDVELLARLFLARFSGRTRKSVKGLRQDALRALAAYNWPGNVRQLENEMEKAVTLVGEGEIITPDLLSGCITGVTSGHPPASLKDELRMVEKRRILAALRECGWNKTHAARRLGDLSRPALIAKMKRLGIPLKPD
jgi:transcriptional regulator with AAA-type ATPase domain/tetratricopeptide (TPR) repeat protein